ncbi:Dephospho-CoA kinase [hydrothermal vent metagenome]|uniref:Dephospho-CoA kinase n=1 Tax=hydrothermal vent metagenome TaxID=652676 RepID=A0A1W1E9D7_9ZZZZ
MAFAYAVALTGGIATGKSSVAKMFEEDGFVVIDADKIAHDMLDEQAETVAQMFCNEVVHDGRVDRKRLGAIVFAEPRERKRLESLLHPLIYQRIAAYAQAEDAKKKPYIVDIPLFFEGKRYPIARTLVVYAPQSLQIARCMQRDGLEREEVLERIAAQIDIEQKRYMADYVIDNSKDQTQLRVEYEKAKEAILKEFA